MIANLFQEIPVATLSTARWCRDSRSHDKVVLLLREK